MSVRYVSLYMVKGKNANAKGGEGFSFMILLMVDVTLLGCPTQFSNLQCHSAVAFLLQIVQHLWLFCLQNTCVGILYWFQLRFHMFVTFFCNPQLQYSLIPTYSVSKDYHVKIYFLRYILFSNSFLFLF